MGKPMRNDMRPIVLVDPPTDGTDAMPAIQAAADTAPKNAILTFRPGVYWIGETVDIDDKGMEASDNE